MNTRSSVIPRAVTICVMQRTTHLRLTHHFPEATKKNPAINPKRGFTLTELLVVISIIALLVAIVYQPSKWCVKPPMVLAV